MSGLKVIIVGAGISGLTLANCLQHAGIDFVVLEGRSEIGLHVGAGVGLEPNGDRILDQLGIRGDMLDEMTTFTHHSFRNAKGKLMHENDGPTVWRQRTGYPLWVCNRKTILVAMYEKIWKKEKVVLSQRVKGIHYENSKPIVTCTDGTTYHGDIVVGADGVHSAVRSEMWRLAELQKPGSIPQADKTYIFAEFRGIYGISDPIEGLDSTIFTLVVGQGEVCYFIGDEKRLFWVLAEKLPEKVCFPSTPKYTDEEAIAFGESKANKPLMVTETMNVTFGDIWKKRQVAALVSVQEGFLEQWTSDNIVLIGDIVHKGTPETGHGANLAIETAASLANHLKRLTENQSGQLSSADIRSCLCDFEAHRKPRARAINAKLMENVRVLTFDNPILKFIVKYVAPRMGDIPVQEHSELLVGAEHIEYLPIPAQSIGTQPYNPQYGMGHWESRGTRALTALPLLAIALYSVFISTTSSDYSRMAELPVYLIWILEAGRNVNFLKPIQWTLLFGLLGHKFGLVLSGGFWFFLYYTWSPVEVFAAADQRLINTRYARSILPSIVLTILLPTMMEWSGVATVPEHVFSSSSWWSSLVLFTITQRFVMSFMTDTTPHDRLYNLRVDLPYIRTTIILGAIISTIAFHTSDFTAGVSISSPIQALRKTNQDFYLSMAALSWLVLLVGDLKRAKMMETSWIFVVISCAVSTFVLGPGATLMVGWAWREEILTTKQHWAAVTKAG